MFDGRRNNFFWRNHHTKIYDFVIVASQNHAYNVFTYIVYIAFYGCHQDFSVPLLVANLFGSFNERKKIRHGFFHNPSRFYHLWQKHFPRTKQIPNDIHSCHQVNFNHFDRFCGCQSSFFNI